MLLRVVADITMYASRELSNGLTPDEAREAIGEAAAELAEAAVRLRRMTRPGPAERHLTVRLLLGRGMTGAEIAARTGLSEKTIARYRAQPAGPPRSPDAL